MSTGARGHHVSSQDEFPAAPGGGGGLAQERGQLTAGHCDRRAGPVVLTVGRRATA